MAKHSLESWTILVEGIVQGVSYRASTRNFIRSNGFKICGHAKNLDNGNVEVFAQGPVEELVQLENFCKKGPSLAKVTNLTTTKNGPVDPSLKEFLIK